MNKLFESGYEGIITEVGLGVPLQSNLFGEAGASNFVLFGNSPYNQAYHPSNKKGIRSVSSDMAEGLALNALMTAEELGFPRPNKKLFSLAITGCHVTQDQPGQSHGWVHIIVDEEWFIVHFTIDKWTSRRFAIQYTGDFLEDLLKAALLGKKPTCKYPSIMSIDVIRWPDLTLKEKLELCLTHNSAVYIDKDGNMQRPADVVRKAEAIYRGSFAPITLAHSLIGERDLFEINCTNIRKGDVSMDDLVHRIAMINLAGRGVLITKNRPQFSELHKWLVTEYGASPNMKYKVGADTFNAICHGQHASSADELNSLRECEFLVHGRNNLPITPDKDGILKYTVLSELPVLNDYSSSKARTGDHAGLNTAVAQYIKDNKLYDNTI